MSEDAAEHGSTQRSALRPGELITLRNMWEAPYNRWAYRNMRELMPSARVSKAPDATEIPREPRDLSALTFRHAGRNWTLDEVIDEAYVDGWVVIHDGAIVFERYAEGMTPETRHICQSVSKSLTGALTGVLVGDRAFDTEALVTDYIPELVGSCWDGCTVQHLLDMTAGVSFDESDYENEESESWRGFRALGWYERLPGDPSPADYVAQMRKQAEHGAEFEYRSICTDVLGWCMERVTGERIGDLFSHRIWEPLGASHEGDFLLGPGGFPLCDGGFCVTLHDLALFGLLFLQEGEIEGRRVVPRDWVRRLRTTDPSLVALFAASPEGEGAAERAFYHDQWWVTDAEAGIYSAYGIHGQAVLVHHPSNSVVARFSTWPHPWDEEMFELSEAASLAICNHLGGKGDA